MKPRNPGFFMMIAIGTISLTTFAQYDPTPPVPVVSATPGEQTSASDQVISQTPLRQPIAMRVVGSNVKNLIGEYLGRIENVVVNGENGMTEFAMLLVNYPTNTTRYTPVPWGSLSYVWDHSQVGGIPGALQVFLLNVDKATLERAPALDRSQWAALRDPNFEQRIAAFFGPSDTAAVGAPGSAGGVIAGGAAGSAVAAPVTSVPAAATTPAFLGGGGGFPVLLPPGAVLLTESNFLGGTNFVITTNVLLTNMVADGIQTSMVINLTNFPTPLTQNTNPLFLQNTNPLFAQETNFFQGGTNLFRPTNFLVPNRPFPAPTTNNAIGLPTGRPTQQQRPFSPMVAPTNLAPATAPSQQTPVPAPAPIPPQQQAVPQQTQPPVPAPVPGAGSVPRG